MQEKLQGELASQLQNFFQNLMEDEDMTKEMQNIVSASLHTSTPGALSWPHQVVAPLLWVVPSLCTTLTSRPCTGYQLVFCLSHSSRNLPLQSCVPETPAGVPILSCQDRGTGRLRSLWQGSLRHAAPFGMNFAQPCSPCQSSCLGC